MAEKTEGRTPFKVMLSGEGVKIDRPISEEQGRAILHIIMGGAIPPQAAARDGASRGSADQSRPNADQTPKQFMIAKRPRSDMERVACLGFYLTHFRATPRFKTKDIEELNTEAATGQLPNPITAVNNASRDGYVTPAGEGKKQLTARGEALVNALPSREAVKLALRENPKRKGRKRKGKKT